MILYEGDIRGFISATGKNSLAKYMASVFERKYSRKITIEQQREWNYSLKCLSGVVTEAGIPPDCCIRLDFVLSQYCSRLEALLAGRDWDGNPHIVMVQLLPWQESRVSVQEDMVEVHDESGWHDMVHPAFQSAAYGRYLSERVGLRNHSSIRFMPVVYLYDYLRNDSEPLLDAQYKDLLADVHLFFSDEADTLSAWLKQYLGRGGGREILNLLHLRDQFCPEGLEDYLNKLDAGNPSITLYEDQKMAAATILRNLDKENQKSITLISGMPGTGKTAIAVTLIHNLTRKGMRIAYICHTIAQMHYLKNLFQSKEGSTDILTLQRFLAAEGKNPGFQEKNESLTTTYDIIIFDESQDLEGKYAQVLGSLLSLARVSVFLYSSSQRILGEKFNLVKYLEEQASIREMAYQAFDLNRNIRFSGKGGGLYWLLHQLQFDTNSNYDDWTPDDYKIEVADHPDQLASYIIEKNGEGYLSRMVANFRKGSLREVDGEKRYVLEEYGFSRPVVMPGGGTSDSWTVLSSGKEMIGTVHMCQGMEFDYTGILIDDLYYDEETGKISGLKETGLKGGYDERLLRNIYHILFTRARKGICIFCRDQALNRYLKDKISYAKRKHFWVDYFINLYAAQTEDRKAQAIYDALSEERQTVSKEDCLKLKAELENVRKDAERYKHRYMAAWAVLESLGITPEAMESIQDQLNEIKDSSEVIADEEERAHYIQDKTATLLLNLFMPMVANQAHVDGIEKGIEQAMGIGAWSKMSPKAKRFIVTAKVVYESIEAYNQLIDFSGVCLQATKAFECEMTYRYFTRYRDYLRSRFKYNYADNIPQALHKLKRGNKIELDEDDYTLGGIVFTAGMWKEGNTIKGYEKDHELFIEYASEELFTPCNDVKPILKCHLEEIEKIRVRYRNSAAHKEPVDVIAARECLDYIVEIQRILGRLLDDYRF